MTFRTNQPKRSLTVIYHNFDQTIMGLETSQSEEYLNRGSQCDMEPGAPIEETLPQNFTPLSLN